MGLINNSALCLAKPPCPVGADYSLGSQAMSFPSEREENLSCFIWVPIPSSCMSLLSLFSSCMLYLSSTYANVPSLPWELS